MSGLALLAHQLKTGATDAQMANSLGVSEPIYAAWVNVDDPSEPPVVVMKQLFNEMDATIVHSLEDAERQRVKEAISEKIEQLYIMDKDLMLKVHDEDVPMVKLRGSILQRLLREILVL